MTIRTGALALGAFRPRFWPTAIALPLAALLLALGIWQLERLAWKEALLQEMAALRAAPPAALPSVHLDPAALAWRSVKVTGRFLHARELYLMARSHRGASGYHVVTPFVLQDGRTLLLDRGWVPPEKKDPAARPEGQVEGEVSLGAIVRSGGWSGLSWLKPRNRPEEGLFIWPDLPAMVRAAGLAGVPEVVTGLYLAVREDAGSGGEGGWPIAVGDWPELKNDHLGYALTWFALAAALLLIYVRSQFRSGAPRQ